MDAYTVIGSAEELLLVDGRVPHHTKWHGALLESVLTLDHNLVLPACAQVVLVLQGGGHIRVLTFSTEY